MYLFWTLKSIPFDSAFGHDAFLDCLKSDGIYDLPILPRRHNRNVIELKNRVFGAIYLSLKSYISACSVEHRKTPDPENVLNSPDSYVTYLC